MNHIEPIARLVRVFASLPGIGEKTATRLALHILNARDEFVEEFIQSLKDVKTRVRLCGECMGFSPEEVCRVCRDPSRDGATICVVADYRDMLAIEEGGIFRGRYHILHGLLAPLKGVGPEDIRMGELLERVDRGAVKEVIIATPVDTEGEATALYIKKVLKERSIRVTRIAVGVPVGGYIEYMDPSTLGRAIEGRQEV